MEGQYQRGRSALKLCAIEQQYSKQGLSASYITTSWKQPKIVSLKKIQSPWIVDRSSDADTVKSSGDESRSTFGGSYYNHKRRCSSSATSIKTTTDYFSPWSPRSACDTIFTDSIEEDFQRSVCGKIEPPLSPSLFPPGKKFVYKEHAVVITNGENSSEIVIPKLNLSNLNQKEMKRVVPRPSVLKQNDVVYKFVMEHEKRFFSRSSSVSNQVQKFRAKQDLTNQLSQQDQQRNDDYLGRQFFYNQKESAESVDLDFSKKQFCQQIAGRCREAAVNQKQISEYSDTNNQRDVNGFQKQLLVQSLGSFQEAAEDGNYSINYSKTCVCEQPACYNLKYDLFKLPGSCQEAADNYQLNNYDTGNFCEEDEDAFSQDSSRWSQYAVPTNRKNQEYYLNIENNYDQSYIQKFDKNNWEIMSPKLPRNRQSINNNNYYLQFSQNKKQRNWEGKFAEIIGVFLLVNFVGKDFRDYQTKINIKKLFYVLFLYIMLNG
eukprot:TRINITY_DN2813_c2_g2_i3.p2 TRINITY_DN2813_c2_g2~~TRINITY_DN2813_c2_g2_i3.p2  ORF type:complete len:489 (-),score=50.98 TRINITY_DN2813_c2_g2_i3:3035-4501(-)